MESGGGVKRRHLSQINVTPFVDVMLVLLIIFMVTAPMMQEGIDVNLPSARAKAISTVDEPVVITIDRFKRLYIDSRELSVHELKASLDSMRRSRPNMSVLLKADETVPYGHVMEAMSEIRLSGIEKLGMVTEPAN
ncbi:MAG: protein TolR [Deltaproteobacteria bacterium]